MVLVLTLHSHLLHRIWGQQGSNIGLDWTIETRDNDRVTDLEDTVDQHHIDRCTVTFDNFNLENCALEYVFLSELLSFRCLSHLTQLVNEIR